MANQDTALPSALKLIMRFEGCVLHPYKDSGGTWTIGWGSLHMPDGSLVSGFSRVITQNEANKMLSDFTDMTMNAVRSMVEVLIDDNQAAALTSLAYNIGTGTLRSSTLMKRLNQSNFESAAADFGMFVYAGGRYVEGLATRRTVEEEVFRFGIHPEEDLDIPSSPKPILVASSDDPLNQQELDHIRGTGA